MLKPFNISHVDVNSDNHGGEATSRSRAVSALFARFSRPRAHSAPVQCPNRATCEALASWACKSSVPTFWNFQNSRPERKSPWRPQTELELGPEPAQFPFRGTCEEKGSGPSLTHSSYEVENFPIRARFNLANGSKVRCDWGITYIIVIKQYA